MRYTIETRQLTSEYTHRPAVEAEAREIIVEAFDEGEAISHFVRQSDAELVSFQSLQGRESIGTVKKDEMVFLVRVYAA